MPTCRMEMNFPQHGPSTLCTRETHVTARLPTLNSFHWVDFHRLVPGTVEPLCYPLAPGTCSFPPKLSFTPEALILLTSRLPIGPAIDLNSLHNSETVSKVIINLSDWHQRWRTWNSTRAEPRLREEELVEKLLTGDATSSLLLMVSLCHYTKQCPVGQENPSSN